MAVTRTSTVELIDLTDKINKIPRTPSVFDQLLNVSDESVTTTTVQVDVVQRNLDLMVAQRRGGERTKLKNASYNKSISLIMSINILFCYLNSSW